MGRKEQILGAVMVMVLITLVWILKNPPESSARIESPNLSLADSAAIAESKKKIALALAQIEEKERLTRTENLFSGNTRDPMTAPTGAVITVLPTRHHAPDLVLSGIMWDSGNGVSQAIINRRVVKEGDAIGGARVARILPDKVIVSVGDQELILEIDVEDGGNDRKDDASGGEDSGSGEKESAPTQGKRVPPRMS